MRRLHVSDCDGGSEGFLHGPINYDLKHRVSQPVDQASLPCAARSSSTPKRRRTACCRTPGRAPPHAGGVRGAVKCVRALRPEHRGWPREPHAGGAGANCRASRDSCARSVRFAHDARGSARAPPCAYEIRLAGRAWAKEAIPRPSASYPAHRTSSSHTAWARPAGGPGRTDQFDSACNVTAALINHKLSTSHGFRLDSG